MKKICKMCGEEFVVRHGNQVYCGDKCNMASFNKRGDDEVEKHHKVLCLLCGKPKEPERQTKSFKYCVQCRANMNRANNNKFYNKTKKKLVCYGCGKIFYSKNFKKFCTAKCNGKRETADISDKISKIAPHLSMAEINRLARKEDLSYGQYCAKYGI